MGWGRLVGESAGFAGKVVIQPVHQPLNRPGALCLARPGPKKPCPHWAGRDLGWEAG